MLLVNGMPLVVIEAKTPVRASQSWLDGAFQVHDDYEKNVPELFVPNVFSFATEGKEFRYGSVRHAGRPVGAVAAGRRGRTAGDARRWRRRSARCSAPGGGARHARTTSRSFATDKGSSASRSSAATSNTTAPTRSSSASSRATRRRA